MDLVESNSKVSAQVFCMNVAFQMLGEKDIFRKVFGFGDILELIGDEMFPFLRKFSHHQVSRVTKEGFKVICGNYTLKDKPSTISTLNCTSLLSDKTLCGGRGRQVGH